MRHAATRLVHAFLLLFGVSLLSFLLLELAPGSFFDEMRLNPQISPETVAALRHHFGIDESLPVRYWRWLRSVAGGDFGFSFSYNSPVGPLLWERARNTLLLTGSASILAWLLAVPFGVWAAARPRGLFDRLQGAVNSVLLAVPELLLALALLLLAVRTGKFPTGGMVSPQFSELELGDRIRDLAWHLFLPVLALALGMFPMISRHVRTAMLEVLQSPFLRALRGHGIPPRRMLFRHALPVAANTLISLLGYSIATLLSASLLTEVIMSWPGLGPLLLEAILARDLYVVIGAVMMSTLFLVLGNWVTDVLLFASDPRIRRG
jgi:peptide/nickel transport system permease protein